MNIMTFGILGVAGLVALAIVVGLGFLIAISLRKVVPTNMVHIVQSKKNTTPYGRGKDAGAVYYRWPSFLPIVGVQVTELPESNFDVSLSNYVAYDVGRLPFHVDVKAFFRIGNAETAAQRVSNFDELREQLTDVLRGSIRKILATNKLEEILQDRARLGEEFTKEVEHSLKEWGVESVRTIEFMNIQDHPEYTVIADIMSKEVSRINRESREVTTENDRAASLKEIVAAKDIELSKTAAKQEVGIRQAEADREVGINQERTKQEVLAETAETTAKDMEVARVRETKTAEIQKAVSATRAEEAKVVEIVAAEAAKQRTVIHAQATKEQLETVAKGKLTEAELAAQGISATGSAEAEARKAMEMALVSPQITLAQEIGENPAYQKYLVDIRNVEAQEKIGIANAGALEKADIKVIANTGDAGAGIASLGELFTAKGGTHVGAMLEAIQQTPQGQALFNAVVNNATATKGKTKA